MGIGKRDTAIFLAAIALTVLGVVRVFYESAVPTAAWGLSFRQEGTAPVGNAGTEQLRQYDAAYIGDTREKVLYLTFDAGYENGSTEKILDTLKAHKVPAAFSWWAATSSGTGTWSAGWWRMGTLWAITPCTTTICRSSRTRRPFPKS